MDPSFRDNNPVSCVFCLGVAFVVECAHFRNVAGDGCAALMQVAEVLPRLSGQLRVRNTSVQMGVLKVLGALHDKGCEFIMRLVRMRI